MERIAAARRSNSPTRQDPGGWGAVWLCVRASERRPEGRELPPQGAEGVACKREWATSSCKDYPPDQQPRRTRQRPPVTLRGPGAEAPTPRTELPLPAVHTGTPCSSASWAESHSTLLALSTPTSSQLPPGPPAGPAALQPPGSCSGLGTGLATAARPRAWGGLCWQLAM